MNLQKLTTAERILLAEELWDSVISDEKSVPITDDQKALIEKRLALYSIDKNAGDFWETVRKRISKT